MMNPIVFISYYKGTEEIPGDGSLAEQLKDKINDALGPDSCELGPLLKKEVSAIPEHIAQMIEAAHYFVVIIPENSSSWVDQEIGYAYARARVGTLKIITIYRKEDRSDLEGFISKGSHHLAADFKLVDEFEKTWTEVITFIKRDRFYPLEMSEIAYQEEHRRTAEEDGKSRTHGYIIIFNLVIENTTLTEIEGATIDFVIPIESKQSDIRAFMTEGDFHTVSYHPFLKRTLAERRPLPIETETISIPLSIRSHSVPSGIANILTIENKELPNIYRRTYFLEKLPPMFKIDIPFEAVINFPDDCEECEECEAHLGIYLQVPRFGFSLNEILIRSMVENPREKIKIHDRDKARISIHYINRT